MVDFNKVVSNFYKIPCSDIYHDYRSSKEFIRELRRAPKWQDGDYEPRVLIDLKRLHSQGSEDVEKRLAKKRQWALQVLDDIILQKKKLLNQEEAFQESFKQFNRQVIINRQKRERTSNRIIESKAAIQQRQDEIFKMLEEVVKMRSYKQKFSTEIEKYLIYEEYIKKILEYFGKSATVFDIVQYFLILDSKLRFLTKKNMETNENIKDLYKQTNVTIHNGYGQVMNLRNVLYQHTIQYDQAFRRVNELEALNIDIRNKSCAKYEDLVTSIPAIRNLYALMAKIRKKVYLQKYKAAFDSDQNDVPVVFEELSYIKNNLEAIDTFIEKLNNMVRKIQRLWAQVRIYMVTHRDISDENSM